MPTFAGNYGAYNVVGTFNQWFNANITGAGVPAWMTSARVVYDWGIDKPLISGYSGHAFALNHLSDIPGMNFQGRAVDNGSAGVTRHGQVEISCWISQAISRNSHMQRLRHMRDMVTRLFVVYPTVTLTNLNASITSPPSLTARILLDGVEFSNPQADSINADLWRIRGLASYTWIERY